MVHKITIPMIHMQIKAYTNKGVEVSWKNMLNAQNVQMLMKILSNKLSFFNMIK